MPYVPVCCVHVCGQVPVEIRGGIRSFGANIIGSCELLDVGAGYCNSSPRRAPSALDC